MQGGKPLRLYANPVRILLYLLGSAAFVAGGLWLLRHPTANANPLTAATAWFAIVFFGIGTAIFLLMFIRDVVVRRAILRIDSAHRRAGVDLSANALSGQAGGQLAGHRTHWHLSAMDG